MIARLSPDRLWVELEGGGWSQRFPAADLPRKLQFYRAQRDRKQGRYAVHYQPTVRALEAVAATLAKVA